MRVPRCRLSWARWRPRRACPYSEAMPSSNEKTVESVLSELAARRELFLTFVARRAGQNVDPQDVLQQAMLRASEGVRELREADRAIAWFYTILRRTLSDAKRTAESGQQILDPEAVAAPEHPVVCDCSLRELESLAPQYADLLRRIDLQGQSTGVVATELGLTSNNVLVRLHRARQSLRARLKARCGTTSSSSCQSCAC